MGGSPDAEIAGVAGVAGVAKVVVFTLGGTIAMTNTHGAGVAPALDGGQLVAAVPGLAESGIDVHVRDFRRLPGASLGIDDLLDLAEAIDQVGDHATGATGVVVTQGTDTIEESAYLLDLAVRGSTPVVVTGAMRNPTLAGPDGPANLLAAIQVAASPVARGLGCLVVFADQIHAAGQVRKVHSTSPGAFVSSNTGPLGYLVEGRPVLLATPGDRVALPSPPTGPPVRVPLVTATLGEDGGLLDHLADRVDGLVVAGFGAGHVPASMVTALTDLAARVPVVLASRTGAGSVLATTYGFTGSERDLLDRGLVSAGFLDPLKARILLHLSIRAGATREQIVRLFAVAGGLGAESAPPA